MLTPLRFSTVAAVACGALIAGCGGSSSPSGSTSTSSPGKAEQSAAPSKAEATKAANLINLRPRDLPHSTATQTPNTTGPLDTELASCAGTSPPKAAIVNLNSPSLNAGSGVTQESFSSNVKVLPSKEIVAKDLAAIQSAKAQACIRSLLPKAISRSASRVKFGGVTITPLSTSASGADGAFGYRLAISATAAGQRLAIVIDEFGAAVGRIELTLNDFGIGTPASPARESRLLSKLVRRAVANKL